MDLNSKIQQSYLRMERKECEVCGLEYYGDECPQCVIKCPFCNVTLGENAIDAYDVGSCTHFICLYNPFTDYIIWRNEEYEHKFILFCENLCLNEVGRRVKDEYSESLDTEKAKIEYFAIINEILCLRHNICSHSFENVSPYLFVKKT